MEKKLKKIEQLKKKQDQIKAQIQALEAADRARERKRETRRKILIGSYYLERAKKEGKWPEIIKRMDDYLTRDSDRVLFDLEPVPTDDVKPT